MSLYEMTSTFSSARIVFASKELRQLKKCLYTKQHGTFSNPQDFLLSKNQDCWQNVFRQSNKAPFLSLGFFCFQRIKAIDKMSVDEMARHIFFLRDFFLLPQDQDSWQNVCRQNSKAPFHFLVIFLLPQDQDSWQNICRQNSKAPFHSPGIVFAFKE